MTTPSTSTFAALDPQRAELRRDLAATLRVFGRRGFQFGLAGHATVRDPGTEELYWVNPAGVPFEHVRPDDLVLVRPDGEVVEGRHEAFGYGSQLEVHRARPDLRAGFHVHSVHTFAWSSRGGLLPAVTTDSAWIAGLQAERVSLDQPAADALGATARILLQRTHGAVTFGETIQEAGFYFLALERAAYTQLLLASAGRADEVPAEVVAQWGLSPEQAHRQFQPLVEAELTAERGGRP